MNEIQLSDTNLTKEILTNESKLNTILAEIDNLKSLNFDFSTKNGVEEAKGLKTQANKFIKKLKDICEPLEAEGKAIADARSKISTRLSTGKNCVIEQILKPIDDVEQKIKAIRDKLIFPLPDINSVNHRLREIEDLKNENWLIYQDEAIKIIDQLHGLALVKQQQLEEEAKERAEQEEKSRTEREDKIRAEAEERSRQAIINAENRAKEAERLASEAAINAAKKEREKIESQQKYEEQERLRRESDIEHKKKINNELAEYLALEIGGDGSMIRDEAIIFAKKIVVAIAKGKIPNISIKY